MVYDRLPEPHFFCSVAKDGDADQLQVLKKHYPEDRIHIEEIEQPEVELPENLESLLAMSPNEIAAHSTPAGVLKQFWHLVRVSEFAGGLSALGKFDLVVRMRPDLKFHSFPEVIDFPPGPTVLLPWWSRSGGVNDRFAIMRPEAVKPYFHALLWARMIGWPELKSPIHPESMLAASLYHNSAFAINRLATMFSIMRKDGTLVLPDPSYADMADLMLSKPRLPPLPKPEAKKEEAAPRGTIPFIK